jgi:hypothetical protein
MHKNLNELGGVGSRSEVRKTAVTVGGGKKTDAKTFLLEFFWSRSFPSRIYSVVEEEGLGIGVPSFSGSSTSLWRTVTVTAR